MSSIFYCSMRCPIRFYLKYEKYRKKWLEIINHLVQTERLKATELVIYWESFPAEKIWWSTESEISIKYSFRVCTEDYAMFRSTFFRKFCLGLEKLKIYLGERPTIIELNFDQLSLFGKLENLHIERVGARRSGSLKLNNLKILYLKHIEPGPKNSFELPKLTKLKTMDSWNSFTFVHPMNEVNWLQANFFQNLFDEI